ncbi:MAG: sulfotransferase [Woeseiaceae bacterium]|nr:sulfotransferase [Woeseiaceae bacterium]
MSRDAAPTPVDALEQARQLVDANRHADAEAALLASLGERDGSVAAYALLAEIECALGRADLEARALEQALALVNENTRNQAAPLWARLGANRGRRGDHVGAKAAFERAVKLEPSCMSYLRQLATAHLADQDLDAARRCADEMLQRFPDESFTHLFAGHVQKATGNTSSAAASYRRALERDATLGEALYNLVEMSGEATDATELATGVEIASRPDVPVADRINAAFACARLFDRAAQFADAWGYLKAANDLAREDLASHGIRYDAAIVEERVARTIADYPLSSFRSAIEPLAIDLLPVFVIGLPRSGTTLIEQILSSHSQVQAGGELLFARECEYAFRTARRAAGRDGPVDPADATDADLLCAARERYIDALFERGLSGPVIVDKLPANFEIAGFLRLIFPGAPIIHSVRDPRATGFSLYNANFAAHEPWYHDLEDLAHFHGQYRRLMDHWQQVLAGPFLQARYEDLVREPEAGIAALLDELDLPFEPACLEFHRNRRPILTASHAQVQRPAYTSSIEHWRNYATWLGPVRRLGAD